MNRIQIAIAVIVALAACYAINDSHAQKNEAPAAPIPMVFEASTPCSVGTRPLPGIPVNADCEFIHWNLTLYQNPKASSPGTYTLTYVFGLGKAGTSGFINGGTSVESVGEWSILKGRPSDPAAVVYRLSDKKTNKAISFLKLNDDLLHLLDSDGHLMIGSAAWSYTLNRISKK